MKRVILCLIVIGVMMLCAGIASAAGSLETLKTPAELSNWARTTSSQEVIDFAKEVAQNSGGRIRLEYLAWTSKGNLVPLFVMGSPAPKGPADVPADKAIVFVNCNIHSGEVEGKESMLIFAREVALGKHDDLLKDLVILLCPNMSPDGNDDLGTWRRSTQFTPALVGTRNNGQGFNMNRDMTKLEAYESRALVELMNKWDPAIFVDAHATNGSYMRHAVTYNWGLHPNTDPDLMAYNRDEFSRKAIGKDSYLYKTYGAVSIPYGNFGQNYSGLVDEGWWTFEDYPRYTTNYAGLRNRLAMLLEVYSYDDFKTRVDTQYACIYGIMQTVAQDKAKIKALIKQADDRSLARATRGLSASDVVCLDSKMEMLTEVDGGYVDVMSYAKDANGQVTPTSTDYDADGFKTAIHFAAEETYRIPYYGKFVPSGTEPMGALYIVRPGCDPAVTLLLRHGIDVRKTTEDVKIGAYQWFSIKSLDVASAVYEGHHRNTIQGDWIASSDLTIPAGSYVISTAQVLGGLAALLLEAESVDGLAAWNYFDNLITTESTRYDPFYTTISGGRRVLFPVWKTVSYGAIPADKLTKVDEIPHDQSLPGGEGSSSSGGSSGCNVAFSLLAGLGVAAMALLPRRRSK